MKGKILDALKKILMFCIVSAVSFLILILFVDASGLLYQSGFIGVLATFLPFILPVVLGVMAVKKKWPKQEKTREHLGEEPQAHLVGPDLDAAPASLVKSKGEKTIYKRWWLWAIVLLVLLGNCGSSEETSTEIAIATESTEVPVAVETEIEPVTTTLSDETSETAESQGVSIETALVLIENTLSDSFSNYEITHSDNLITINVWQYGIAAGVDAAANGDTACQETWRNLVESQERCCTSIYNLVQTMELADTAVALNVLNDNNKENTLLSTINGVVVYNCVSDRLTAEPTETTVPQTEETKSPREQLDEILETYNPVDFEQNTTYVLNTNTMKFHYKWCSSADDIKASNRMEVTTTRADVISRGYQACKRCNP